MWPRIATIGLLFLGGLLGAHGIAQAQDLTLDAVNKAEFSRPESAGKKPRNKKSKAPAVSAVMLKAQVLLDRARFSPGVIDGRDGENVRKALAAFEAERGLKPDGELDPEVWAKLAETSGDPALIEYTIVPEDVKGPFQEKIPQGFDEQAKLPRLAYTGPEELLAEKFHVTEELLKSLNAEKPAPSGEHKVRAIAENPEYTYNPEFKFKGVKADKKLTIKPGPNNPVGAVWIDLTLDTYGIHGTPEPRKVGKSYSHGCVRLTNWDARALARMVEKGTTVAFID